jgi:cytochrome c553
MGIVCRTGVVRAQETIAASERVPWDLGSVKNAEALRLEGNAGDGERAFEVCSHCHLPTGAGREDGSIPQLAGQHRSVLIKQIIDIREGHRDNPLMDPFARTIVDPHRLANVAAYLEALPIPRNNGRGPGSDLETGASLYGRDCSACHGGDGQGNATELVPVLAGQHYEYILRQLHDIAAIERKNIHPVMQESALSYSSEQIAAIADYVSRLEWPERQQN